MNTLRVEQPLSGDAEPVCPPWPAPHPFDPIATERTLLGISLAEMAAHLPMMSIPELSETFDALQALQLAMVAEMARRVPLGTQ